MKQYRLFALLALLAVQACKTSDYEMTAHGLQYKMHIKSEGVKAKEGDFVTLNISWRNERDSLLQSMQAPPFRIVKPSYQGDFMEGFTLMGAGDSATFLVSVDSFFQGRMPSSVKAGTYWKLDTKMLEIMSEQQIQAKMQSEQQKMMEAANKQLEEDIKTLEAYLAEKKIKVQKTESGLFYTVDKEGKGEQAKAGNKVSVHYTGTLLNGNMVDSSRDHEPYSFLLGQGQVMLGWDEGIALFKKGGKGKLFIPSPLAYGPRGRGDVVPPNAILVFEVELMDVK